MREEGLWEEISAALTKQFPNAYAYIIEISDETFIYGLKEYDNYSYYIGEYNITPSGSLNIEWENAGLTDPNNIEE
jgi:hypothetical protein